MHTKLQALCDRLGYEFSDPTLLQHALRHSSFSQDRIESNERLEFLGDAVLGLTVSALLYEHYPNFSEGDLSELKSSFVDQKRLAATARTLKIQSCLMLGKSEVRNRGQSKDRILADAMEAILGAIYLDGGIDAVRALVWCLILLEKEMPDPDCNLQKRDSKTVLQEWLQSRGLPVPDYVVVETEGPSHKRKFIVEARCGSIITKAEGPRIKAAEGIAATQMMERLVAEARTAVSQTTESSS